MKRGFTLVELSIVLVIIGLLAAGVLIAQSMISTAKAQSMVRTFQQYNIIVSNFRHTFKYYPGDLPNNLNAQYFDTSTRASDGGGDGWLGGINMQTDVEKIYAFGDLSTAGMLPTRYPYPADWNDVIINTTNMNANKGIYFPKLDGAGYLIMNSIQAYTTIPELLHCKVSLSAQILDSSGNNGMFTPAQAMAIDSKMDDGKPWTGKIIGYHHGPSVWCITPSGHITVGANHSADHSYDTSVTIPACAVDYCFDEGNF